MNRLSTHILDTSHGQPAPAVPVHLYQADRLLTSRITDADGRCANLVPENTTLKPGTYRIVFDITAYFPDGLYPEVAITFRVDAGATHYHIPLLLSPFGYTTYRGS